MADSGDAACGLALQMVLAIDFATSAVCLHQVILPRWSDTRAAGQMALAFWAAAGLMMTAYIRAWATDPNLGIELGTLEPGIDALEEQARRICSKCKTFRPPRAHHCSQCGRCILRYDHHCMCFRSCIGLGNLKFFFLFLLWGLLTAVLYLVAAAPYCLEDIRPDPRAVAGSTRAHALLSAVVPLTALVALFGAIALGSLFVTHFTQIASDKTSLEVYRAYVGVAAPGASPAPNSTARGSVGRVFSNVRGVLGGQPLVWLLPVQATRPAAARSA